MKPNQSKNKGFTLVEMIVAVSIMAMLSVLVVQAFKQGTKSRAVALGADVVSNSIRTAQTQSQNPRVFTGSVSPCSAPDNVPSEFHLRFNTASPLTYPLFAYAKCENPPVTPVTLQDFILPREVRLKQADGLEVDGVSLGGSGSTLEIKILPPFGKLTVSKNGGPYASFRQAKIILESTSDGSFIKAVTLDGLSGRVDIQ